MQNESLGSLLTVGVLSPHTWLTPTLSSMPDIWVGLAQRTCSHTLALPLLLLQHPSSVYSFPPASIDPGMTVVWIRQAAVGMERNRFRVYGERRIVWILCLMRNDVRKISYVPLLICTYVHTYISGSRKWESLGCHLWNQGYFQRIRRGYVGLQQGRCEYQMSYALIMWILGLHCLSQWKYLINSCLYGSEVQQRKLGSNSGRF